MQPRLSVVVPIHNVEHCLEECLRSIAAQTVPWDGALEVVLVDDGSTDGSTRIAQAFADRDPRLRYVRQEHAGLGAARNTGVQQISPGVEFLAFADSDDVVPHGAYHRMITSLESTGSDFATGNVWRLDDRGRHQTGQYTWLTKTRERTHITRDPELLSDRVAWNKVFRRAFWQRHGLSFPEGGLYEDTPVIVPAHFLASSVDVLHDHVYYRREGSLTGQRTDVRGVRDRIAACDEVSRFLAERFPEHRRSYDTSCLRDDFGPLLDGLPMGGPEYRAAFLVGAAAFLARADPGVIDALPVDLRVKWHLVRERRLADLIAVLSFEQRGGAAFGVRGAVRRAAVHPDASGGRLRVPARTARLRRGELPVVARLERAEWQDDGTLRIDGYAYVRNLPSASPGREVRTGILKSARHKGVVRRVPTRSVPSPAATEDSGQELHVYDHSGFSMIVDPDSLKVRGRREPGSWLLGVLVAGHGTVRRAAVRAPEGPAAQALVRELEDGFRLVLTYSRGRLVLEVVAYHARVESHRAEGDEVVLHGRLHGPRPTVLRLTHTHADARFDCPVEGAGDDFAIRLPVAAIAAVPPAERHEPKEVEPPHSDRWQAELMLPDGSSAALAAVVALPPGRYPAGAGRELCATADDSGQLVVELTRQPVADSLRWTDGGSLVVEGTVADASWGDAELVLRHDSRHEEVAVDVHRAGGRFTARVEPAIADGGLPLRQGRWYAFLRELGADGDGVPVRTLASLAGRLPLTRACQGRDYSADRRFGDRLLIDAAPRLAREERGAYRQAQLRTVHYAAQRELPLKETVLYVGGDSPRAVQEELLRRGAPVEHLWVTHDGRSSVPAGADGVELHSSAWYEALARCRRIVTAGHLPDFFERRSGQTVVQTWHGNPFKRIGTDLTGSPYADHSQLDVLARATAQWSVLVAPGRRATARLSRALAYRGELLQAGSPANDLLFADDRGKIADRVRARLGLPPGRRVVLYAPTYRDHLGYAPDRYRHEQALDLAAAESALGDDHVLLVRRHPLAAGPLPGARPPFVVDVSAYPQVAELLLVADVLVTDYTSLAFDFALTGRPMLFHTYDLEQYRDTVRGFCLDFEATVPGPLLRSTEDVVTALRDLDAVAERHARAYAAFRQAYCDLDDGRAAARVADRLLR
nr:CDP-glycerol glycerophosphotransferase family protein [Streptomyces sp. YIM 130001]